MRTLTILLLHLFMVATTSAQKLSGWVKDNKQKPLAGVTIALFNAADSAVSKYSVTDEKGFFTLNNLTPDTYQLNISMVGYNPVTITIIFDKDSTLDPVILTPVSKALSGVMVTAKRPVLEIKGDKTILNVEGTINATGTNALELLRRSPGVSVNQDERLSLNGKNGVQVFIDGKPTPLAGSDLSNYLKTLQSAQVEAIELITNPSARFEAAGNAGIINIRLKKNKTIGTNAIVSAGVNAGIYGKYNAGIALNHRSTRLNIFGGYNVSGGINQKEIAMYRALSDSVFDQQGLFLDDTKAHNVKAGLDFFINKQSTIGMVANGNFSNTSLFNFSTTAIRSATDQKLGRTLVADNKFKSGKDHADVNLNYQYNSAAGKSLSLNADYGFYHIRNDQLQPNRYYNSNGMYTGSANYRMLAPASIDIYSFKADYETPFASGKLAAGTKLSRVRSDNDFRRYNLAATEELDRERSNQFIYQEQINAGYVNYNRQWNNFQWQLGLRAENTVVNGHSIGAQRSGISFVPFDSSIHQNYLDLFPSASLTYAKNQDHQFTVSASRRIDRPVYQDLNPFEYKVDDYLLQKGNPYLKPQYTHSIGINYLYAQKLNAALNYSGVKDLSGWILDTVEGNKGIVSKKNLAKQNVLSLNLSYPIQYKSFSSFASLSANYSMVNGRFGPGRTIDEKAVGVNIFVQNALAFSKTWTAELTGFYNAPTVQEGNMHTKGMWSVDAGVQAKLMEDRATLKISVADVCNSLRFRSTSQFAGQSVSYNTKWESRQAKLSLVYRLGSAQIKAARQRRSGAEEEMKRVQ